MRSATEILLEGVRNIRSDVPTQEYEHVRLSKERGEKVIFRLQAVSYNRTAELAAMGDEMDVQTVLSGVVEPSFRDERLAVALGLLKEGEHWGDHGVTPEDLVKSMLLPGEITAISNQVQKLSGYQTVTLKEIKKN